MATQRKHYLLWFVLDLRNVQRYFCNCGCYETMTRFRVFGWSCRFFRIWFAFQFCLTFPRTFCLLKSILRCSQNCLPVIFIQSAWAA